MPDRTISTRLQLRLEGWQQDWRRAAQTVKTRTGEIQRDVHKSRDAINDTARGMALFGAAAGVGVGIAVKRFADFDQAMSRVRAATHETAGNMQLLRDAAIEAGQRTAFSAGEAAAGIENLAKAGVSTADILNGGLNGALDLAAAGEIGVAEAAETAATALTQFKLKGSDIPHVADLLAAAAGKAQGEVGDMAQALNQGGLVAAQMGLSIEETTATLASFAEAGLLGSDAGTSFKTMLLRLANPSKEAASTMRGLGIAAYDTQGGFIGIAPLAEQLRTRLKGLSQQQRDAALATIFGSDAIRAASVLYQNGAKGIADWTVAVNDAGFAADTAAIKQDNLRGDIEKLGGSFDSALIKSGSGANDALRGIAQGATAAVDGFSGLPESVQQGAVALGAVAAVSGLSAAGLLKVTVAAADAREAWQNLGRTGRTLTLSMGAVGVALAAATVAYGVFAKRNAEAEDRVENLRATLDQQTGAITRNTRAYVSNELAQSGLAQKAKDLGLNLSLMTDAALGNGHAIDLVVGSLDRMIEAGRTTEIIANELHPALTADGQAAKALKDSLLGTNKELFAAQKQQRLAAEGAQEHKSAQQLQAEAVKASQVEVKKLTDSLKEKTEAAYKAAGGALSLRDAENDYYESIAAVNAALKENGRGLSVTTEKGRANREVLDGIASAANDLTESMIENGRGHDAARSKAEEARRKFVEVAVRMGLNKVAAKKLAEQLIAIPPKAHTSITNTAPTAKAQVVDYRKNGLGAIPGVVPTLIQPRGVIAAKQVLGDYRTNGLGSIPGVLPTTVRAVGVTQAKKDIFGFAAHVDTTLGGIADEAVRVSLSFSPFTRNAPGGRPPKKHASGGQIEGASPSPTADDIPIMATAGEWMHPVAAVRYYGTDFMEAVRTRRFPKPEGYATGGGIGGIGLRASTPSVHAIEHTASTVARAVGKAIAQERSGGFGGPPGNVRSFRGHRLNERTIAMVLAAEGILGSAFHITQGSYSTRVAASAGTHAGGGVLDTNGPRGWGAAVGAMRRVGFAAWHRTPSQGPWGHHIHAVAIGDPTASPAAKRQVQAFQRGGTGLAGRARGGPVLPGTSYVVGEDGAEILTMGQGGMVRRRPTRPGLISQYEDGSAVWADGMAWDPETQRLRQASVQTMLRELSARRDLRDELVKYITGTAPKLVSSIELATERIKSLIDQRDQFAASTTSSFTGSLFGQGTSAGDLKLRLDARRNDALAFRKNLELLRRKGLNKGLWAQLASRSDFGAAQQLAQMTPAQLQAISQSFVASQQATAALGAYAGNVQYGAAIAAAHAQQKRDQANLNALIKRLQQIQWQIKTQGGKSRITAVSGG